MVQDLFCKTKQRVGQNYSNDDTVQLQFRIVFARSLSVVGHSLGPGSEKKWYRTCPDKLDGNWDRTAEMMTLRLTTKSGHPMFRASSAFERGDLGSKGHGKKSTRFDDN